MLDGSRSFLSESYFKNEQSDLVVVVVDDDGKQLTTVKVCAPHVS